MNKKLFSTLTVSLIIFLCVIPFAAASSSLVAYNNLSVSSYASITPDLAGKGWGTTFTAVGTTPITELTVNIRHNVAEPINIQINAKICGITGTYGSNARANLDDVKGTSTNTITLSSSTFWLWTSYTFTFNPIDHTNEEQLAWIVQVTSVTTSSAIDYRCGSLDTDFPGDCFYYNSAAFSDLSYDCEFYLYGTDASPTPTPTATPAPNQWAIWNGTHWVPTAAPTPEPNIFDNGTATPYIQMLVPIVILAVAALLGWKFAGAWGFMAGLNIGAILTYMILGSSVFPLWGIVVLLVVDGLLLFGKVGFRS